MLRSTSRPPPAAGTQQGTAQVFELMPPCIHMHCVTHVNALFLLRFTCCSLVWSRLLILPHKNDVIVPVIHVCVSVYCLRRCQTFFMLLSSTVSVEIHQTESNLLNTENCLANSQINMYKQKINRYDPTLILSFTIGNLVGRTPCSVRADPHPLDNRID